MEYEVDAHYCEIACGWRTRGPILLFIYFGRQANSIHVPSCSDGGQFHLFGRDLLGWGLPGIIVDCISHSLSWKNCCISLDSPLPRPDIKKNPPSLHSWHLSVAHQSIVSYHLCLSIIINPRLNGEYLHLWSASRWRSMKTMCASFATWSTAIRVRMGKEAGRGEEGRGGGGGGEGACTQIANVWERADFHRREVRLNCSKSGAEVANTLGL